MAGMELSICFGTFIYYSGNSNEAALVDSWDALVWQYNFLLYS